MKSTKMSASYGNSLVKLLKSKSDDTYFFEVLYYYIRRALIACDYNLSEVGGFDINGRFFGFKQEVLLSDIYTSPMKSLGLAMSIRAFMLDINYLDKCYDDRLLFFDLSSNLISWHAHRAIMDCVSDDDFCLLYEMSLSYRETHHFTDEQKEIFESNTKRPEYRNIYEYCRSIAQDPDYDGKSVIKDRAYLYEDFDEFEVPLEVDYIGDTAFAYCGNLKKIVIKKKLLLGHFPIIECNNLKQIIVPTECLDYYKQLLPYYKDIIVDKEQDNSTEEDIDYSAIQTVFDKRVTSYKYFWFLSIISLAKEQKSLDLSYKAIVVRMAALAWPLVFEDGIDLGKMDFMEKYLVEIEKDTQLIPAASSKVVEEYLFQNYHSQGIETLLAPLLKNVPYRFLSPWVKFTSNSEVIEVSNQKSFSGLYALGETGIVLNESWYNFIMGNYRELYDFAVQQFVTYAKQYNEEMKLLKLMTDGFCFPT